MIEIVLLGIASALTGIVCVMIETVLDMSRKYAGYDRNCTARIDNFT
jgi:hypothetical protein